VSLLKQNGHGRHFFLGYLGFMLSKPTLLSILVATCFAFVASLLLVGRVVYGPITPRALPQGTSGVTQDGWILSGAEFHLPRLLPLGNTLEIRLDPWRPPGTSPAEVVLRVCGKVVGEFVVDKRDPRHVRLKGTCNPRLLHVEVKNPFQQGSKDPRALGVKLLSLRVTSPFGGPLVSIASLTPFFLAFVLPLIVVLVTFPWRRGIVAATVLFAAMCALFLRADWMRDADNLCTLWGVQMALLVGMLCASFHGHKSEGREPLPEWELNKFSHESSSPFLMYVLLGIVLLGGVLRGWGIHFGLPFPFHPDETPKVNALIRMDQNGDFNPQYFLHPSLLLYATRMVSWCLGLFYDFHNTDMLYRLSGRVVSAFGGTVSIALLFAIGKNLFGSFTGLLGATILAFAPLSVTCSRYMKEDSLMTMWVLLIVYLVLRSVRAGNPKLLLAAGAAAGACAGTKYSGVLTLVLLAIAPWLKSQSLLPDKRYFLFGCLAALPALLAFVITTPYSVLDFRAFSGGFLSEKHHMERGHTFPITASSQYWMYHLLRSLPHAMTPLPLCVGLLGMGLLLWRRKAQDCYLLFLILLFFLPAEWVRAKPAPQPERYMVPVVPFLALAVAEMFRVMSNTRVRAVTVSVALMTVVIPVVQSILYASELRGDTRVKMAEWIYQNIPSGSFQIDYPPYEAYLVGPTYQTPRLLPTELLEKARVGNIVNDEPRYLLLSTLYYDRFFSQPNEGSIRREVIRKIFRTLPIVKEFSPRFGTYGFQNPTVTLFSYRLSDLERLNKSRLEVEQGIRIQSINEEISSFFGRYDRSLVE
jgi:4-amino-4-deoxy-L-arabinose transferase-like glycosyltransferase